MRKRLALCLALLIMTGITAALPGRTEETATGTPLPGRTEFASTSLSGASDAQRKNIRLAVAALDGARVATGGTFSFNDVVGPRTREQGYVSAINGSGAKKLGGGVSQVATTLYLALKQREGIDYLQKRTYGNQFAGNYVDSSYDAIITDSKKSIDFRFINNLSIFYIHIRSTETAIECRLTDSKDSVAWDVSPTSSPSPSPDGGTPVTPTPGGDENQNAAPSPTPGTGQNVTPAPTPESGASRSASSSPTPDVSHTPSLAPDANQNVTHAPTPGANQSVTPAPTPGASRSATPAPTPGASRSVTLSPTPDASQSATSATPGANQSVTPAPTPGASRSVGPSRTPDASQSVTPAPAPGNGIDRNRKPGNAAGSLDARDSGQAGSMKTPAPTGGPASTGTTSGDPVDRPVSDDPDVTSSAQIRLTGSDELIHNVKLACSGIYGMVLRRGETFSFNSLVGPNTQDAGYQEAFDGRGESITGGGVSIVASALWLAVKDMDGVTVTKKSTYGKAYSQSYMASAADAIRTDYEGGADFRFRYKGRGSITVYTYVEDGWLICEVRRNNS